MAKISPSLLSADFSDLREEIRKIEMGGADYLHLDVMDGLYVPNITFGAPVIEKLRKITTLPFDVHLMIDRPERYINDFVKAGANIITVHPESTMHLHRTIQEIKTLGILAGVSLNPSTPLCSIEYVLDDIDLALIMSVNPGFGGQSFIESCKVKIMRLKEMIGKRNILIEVDGGINLNNAKDLIELGADILVAGTAIFGSDDIVKQTKLFKDTIA